MRVRILAGACALLLLACGDGADPPTTPGARRVDVQPSALILAPGQSAGLSAELRDSDGQPVPAPPATWESGDDRIATVSSQGQVLARAVGDVQIRATINGLVGRAALAVRQTTGGVERVEIDPRALSLSEGQQHPFRARAFDSDGFEITGRGQTWTSSRPEVATVAPLGQVTAVRVGSALISVRIDGRSDSAALTVTASYPYRLLFDASPGPGITPEAFSLDISDPSAAPLPLLPAGPRASQIVASPDGTQLAFVLIEGGNTNVYAAAIDGSNLRAITREPGFNDQPNWSPDGTRIAHRRWPFGQDADIWVANAVDGGDAVNLTADWNDSGEAEPAWRDSQILFARTAAGFGAIWVMNDDGTNRRQLTAGDENFDSQPTWSPTGEQIAFQRVRTGIGADLWRMNADGGGQALLLQLPFTQSHPRYSPDGQLIAFVSVDDNSTRQIFTMRSTGGGIAARTQGEADHGGPSWLSSP